MGCRFQLSQASLANFGCQEGVASWVSPAHVGRCRLSKQPVRASQADASVLPSLPPPQSAPLQQHRSSVAIPIIPATNIQQVVDISQQLACMNVSKALQVSTDEAGKILQRNAAVALCSESDVHTRLSQLQSLLSLPEKACVALVQKQPTLLTVQFDQISASLDALHAIFNCSPAEGRKMIIEKPYLLTVGHARLTEKLIFLRDTLSLDEALLRPWITSHPHVLCHSTHSISDKLTWLQSFFGAKSKSIGQLVFKNPSVLMLSSARLCAEVTAMSQTLHGLPLQRMLQREPRMLTITNGRLQQRVQELQDLLQLDKTAALKLLIQRPSLACKSLNSLERAVQVLKQLPLSETDFLQLITTHPLLLRLSPTVLRRRCHSISYVMRKSKVYRYTFSKLPPHLWGVVIMHWDTAANKICYLAESAQEIKMSLLDALRMTSDEQFLNRFPEFSQWQDWKQGGGKDARKQYISQRTSENSRYTPRQHRNHHRTRKLGNAGEEEPAMADFSHYADLPASVKMGRYTLHRPNRPQQHVPHPRPFRSRPARPSSPSGANHTQHSQKPSSSSAQLNSETHIIAATIALTESGQGTSERGHVTSESTHVTPGSSVLSGDGRVCSEDDSPLSRDHSTQRIGLPVRSTGEDMLGAVHSTVDAGLGATDPCIHTSPSAYNSIENASSTSGDVTPQNNGVGLSPADAADVTSTLLDCKQPDTGAHESTFTAETGVGTNGSQPASSTSSVDKNTTHIHLSTDELHALSGSLPSASSFAVAQSHHGIDATTQLRSHHEQPPFAVHELHAADMDSTRSMQHSESTYDNPAPLSTSISSSPASVGTQSASAWPSAAMDGSVRSRLEFNVAGTESSFSSKPLVHVDGDVELLDHIADAELLVVPDLHERPKRMLQMQSRSQSVSRPLVPGTLVLQGASG